MTNYSRSVLLSNGLPHPKIRLKKFGFSPKSVPANMAKKLPPQRCFKPLLIALFQLLAQMAHVCLHSRKWAHTRLSEKDRTQGHTRRNRGILSAVTALSCAAREIVPKEQPEEADARLWRVSASSGTTAPLGCATFFSICLCCISHARHTGISACAR